MVEIMDEAAVFILADKALQKVIAQIKPAQWQQKLPAWFQVGRSQKDPTLRDIINYHAYEDAWVPDMLAGKTMAEAGVENYKGDLLKDDPVKNFNKYAAAAQAAAKNFKEFDRVVHTSFGDFTARQYLWQTNSFRGFRAYDIAKLIGVKPELSDELVQGLWDELSPHFEEWRKMGIFPAESPIKPGASVLDKLLAKSGRLP